MSRLKQARPTAQRLELGEPVVPLSAAVARRRSRIRTAEPFTAPLCSIAATAGLPERAVYSASKGAVLSLTRAMAADHVVEGIRVNCVNPGTVDTPWVSRLLDQAANPAAERTALEARQPTGRLVTADEVAAAVLYLGGPAAGSTTGTALAVDGGMSGLRLRHAPTTLGRRQEDSDLNHSPNSDHVTPTLGES